jgi:hypothetical protein
LKVTRVFFVSNAEYAKLQAACAREFPFGYVEFVKRIEMAVAALSRCVHVVRIDVKGRGSREARPTGPYRRMLALA